MSIFSRIGSALASGTPPQRTKTPPFLPAPTALAQDPYALDQTDDMPAIVGPSTPGGAVASGRTALPKYQSWTEERERLAAERPQEQKIGLGRRLAGLLIQGASPFAGPGVLAAQELGQRVAHGGKYLDDMRQWQQKVENSDALGKVLKDAETDERLREDHAATLKEKEASRLANEASKSATERNARDAAEEKKFNRRITMRQAGAEPYTPPKPLEVPSTLPGMPPTTVDTSQIPTPDNVEKDPEGKLWAIPPKGPQGTVPVPVKEAEELGLDGPAGEYNGQPVKFIPATSLAQARKPEKEPKLDAIRLAVVAAGGDPDRPLTPEVAKKAAAIMHPSQTSGGIQLTPEAVAFWAGAAAKGLPLPSMGYGNSGAQARQQILNAAPGLANGGDLASNRADYRANSESLKKMQSMRDAVVAFEKTAMANTDIFMGTAKKIIDTGSPIINTPIRQIDLRVLGGDELAAYNAARRVAINEIAKVTSNPNLAGVLSDSARHEVETLVPENATLKQLYAVVSVLRRDMANRKKYFDEGIAEIQGRIRGGAQQGGSGQPQGGGTTGGSRIKILKVE